ncbi:MAG TPA: hypothetical protein VIX41_05570 [Acidimicrobiales bacterium]
MAEQPEGDVVVCSECRSDAERVAHDVAAAPSPDDLDPEVLDVLPAILFGSPD